MSKVIMTLSLQRTRQATLVSFITSTCTTLCTTKTPLFFTSSVVNVTSEFWLFTGLSATAIFDHARGTCCRHAHINDVLQRAQSTCGTSPPPAWCEVRKDWLPGWCLSLQRNCEALTKQLHRHGGITTNEVSWIIRQVHRIMPGGCVIVAFWACWCGWHLEKDTADTTTISHIWPTLSMSWSCLCSSFILWNPVSRRVGHRVVVVRIVIG